MDRRGFIGSILALGAAPAIVRADALMRVIPVDTVMASTTITLKAGRPFTAEELARISQSILDYHMKNGVLRKRELVGGITLQ